MLYCAIFRDWVKPNSGDRVLLEVLGPAVAYAETEAPNSSTP